MPSKFRSIPVVLLLFGFSLCSRTLARAQNALYERILRVSELNRLDGPGMKPWHLKLTYLSPDGSAGDGSLEEWWASPDRWRQQWTSNGETRIVVRTADGEYSSETEHPASAEAQDLYAQIVHPIDADSVTGTTPEQRPLKTGNVQLDCLMLSLPIKGLKEIPLGLFPTYCVQGDVLRVSHPVLNESVVTQRAGTFQGHTVAVKVQVLRGTQLALEGTVDQLTTYVPDDAQFDTKDLVKGPAGEISLSAGEMGGHIVHKVQPVYPDSARAARVSGTVLLQVKIGEDGRVHIRKILSSPDPSLTMAALIAVEQWQYSPYSLNGVPTAVTTTIAVNFQMNHI